MVGNTVERGDRCWLSPVFGGRYGRSMPDYATRRMTQIGLLLGLGTMLALGCGERQSRGRSDVIESWIARSKDGDSLVESPLTGAAPLGPRDWQAAEEYVRSHADRSSYLLLLALRTERPEVFDRIPPVTRSAILCDGLAHVKYLNDWGYLNPGGSYDDLAAVALLEAGSSGLPHLERILDNLQTAPLSGSEEATISRSYRFRRADFAYRYISLILGLKPDFDPKPEVRDRAIAELRKKLAERKRQAPKAGA